MNLMQGCLSRESCAICQGPLTVHQEIRGGVCDRPRCRRALLERHLEQRRQREAAAVRKVALDYRAKVASSLELESPEALIVAIVSCYDKPIRNLPEKRRRRFRDFFTELISQAVANASSESADSAYRRPEAAAGPTPEEQIALGKACATCRGRCCTNGCHHAYMDVRSVRRYMSQNPGIRPRDVLEAYVDRLPNKSFQDSCVFHTAGGCALPRSMRSHLCNNTNCEGLNELWMQLAESKSSGVLVVAMEGDKILRSSMFRLESSRSARGGTNTACF
jgi:hypothetical protein